MSTLARVRWVETPLIIVVVATLTGCQVVAGLSERSTGAGEPAGGGGGSSGATVTQAGGAGVGGQGEPAGGGAAGTTPQPQSGCAFAPGTELEPPFATPDVVYERLAQVMFHAAMSTPLPTETTIEWVDEVVALSLETTSHAEQRKRFDEFLLDWLQAPPEWGIDSDWLLLAKSNDVLQTLLTKASDARGTLGVFAESAMIKNYPSISGRGRVMYEALWYQPLGHQPMGVSTSLEPAESRRKALEAATAEAACRSCHDRINPLGFSLETLSESGEFRATVDGVPVDTSGSIQVPGDTPVMFMDAVDLGNRVAGKCATILGFVSANYIDALKATGRSVPAGVDETFESEERARLAELFGRSDRSYLSLLRALGHSKAVLSP